MCGIAGICSQNAKQYAASLKNMTDAIAFRGPDAENFVYLNKIALGHRRLSIIDTSSAGDQPMYSHDRKQVIVLNGELYGYKELKKKYDSYPYQNHTDTEVILAMYQAKGENLLEDFNGMFAFAIWDLEKQELFCARDRFGEKPFFYATSKNGEWLFASEIKALLASGLVEPKLNPEAVYSYLKYGYINPHQTIYSNVYTLPPAHKLNYKNGKIKVSRYWKIPSIDSQISIEDAVPVFNELLNKSIDNQLTADVEVGAFLSGGLDSSTIVAKASQYTDNLTTLAFGYERRSELPYAKQVAKKYHTNHIEILETDFDKVEKLREITPYFDEPFADVSFIPTFEICNIASQSLKVMLSGDVGDELFGGYHFYKVESEIRNHRLYKKNMIKFILKWYQKFRNTSFVTNQISEYKNILDFHQNYVRNIFNDHEILKLGINAQFHQKYSFTPDPDSVNNLMRIDLEKYVPGNMLLKSDRMAMANSLEVRTPFLDVPFAEFCIALPAQLKVNSTEDKIILREACQELWPKEIRKRSKRGFGIKDSAIFKDDVSLQKFARDILTEKSQRVFEIIDFQEVQNQLDGGKKEWTLLNLALWAQNFPNFT